MPHHPVLTAAHHQRTRVIVEAGERHATKVAECALVAMPDERLGERGCVFIVTKGNAALRLVELTQFLGAEGMAKPYWPERLEILPEMPRTPSGKIQKFKLRAMAADLKPEAMQR